jgi:hypothetical protein
VEKCSEVPTLYVDNASAVKLMKDPEFHTRSKHIEVRYCFINECYQGGRRGVKHIDGLKQLADLLTKPLDQMRVENLRNDIGV